MTREQLLGQRLAAQALLPPGLDSPVDVVSRLGAVQAQDFRQALLAVATRTHGATAASVEACLTEGSLVRTHVLRPTWHLVTAADLRWMLALTGPRITRSAAGRYRQLGLTPEIRALSRRTIEAALTEGPLGREELKLALAGAGVPTEGQSLVHCLMDAELALVVCSGPQRGKEATYDLVDRRVPASSRLDPEEARAQLALRYASGHGPVTDRDFAWWSGLPLTEARRGLEACGKVLSVERRNETRVWFDHRESMPPPPFSWLPAFDEYIIAYTDRTAVLPVDQSPRVISSNGIFWPVVLFHGVAAGTWSAPLKKGVRPVEVDWFGPEPAGGEHARQAWEAKLRELTQ